MATKIFYIYQVLKDSHGKQIKFNVCCGKTSKVVGIDELRHLFKVGICTNAVLVKGSYVRAKAGKKILFIVQTDKDDIKDLSKYKNSKEYDGNTDKCGVTINGVDYIAKYPKREGDSSIFSEHVASKFIRNLGYEAHETKLIKTTKGLVVLLKDFAVNGAKLRPFKDTEESSADTDINNKNYTYDDIKYMISKHTKIPESLKKESIKRFWEMYLLDAILGNRDRHHGNWGYLAIGKAYTMAPIFDNGSSLFPDVQRELAKSHNWEEFIAQRSERYPASLLCEYSESEHRIKRTNYYEYIGRKLKSGNDEEFKEAYKGLVDKGYKKVRQAIISAVGSSNLIPNELKKFYVDIVCVRYLHIIERLTIEDSIGQVLIK